MRPRAGEESQLDTSADHLDDGARPPLNQDASTQKVHGMGTVLVPAVWPPLRESEIAEVLSTFSGKSISTSRVKITWSSPRPMSTAALVVADGTLVFLKRHHHSVRSASDLRVEHNLARYLRGSTVQVPDVLSGHDGDSVFELGEYLYELHTPLQGHDLYRDAISWSPFTYVEHAEAAGRALARFHEATHDFDEPARPAGVLRDAVLVNFSHDPALALEVWLSTRPNLRAPLAARGLAGDFDAHLSGPLATASRALEELAPQWTHGDWHASNLTWTSSAKTAAVAEVFDLGLSNRTYAIHDIALAIERNAIDWLDLARRGEVSIDVPAVEGLLRGYTALRPLSFAERRALVAELPVAHVGYALSEIEYFGVVTQQPSDADLAYDYLIGHSAWFSSAPGKDLLEHVQGVLSRN